MKRQARARIFPRSVISAGMGCRCSGFSPPRACFSAVGPGALDSSGPRPKTPMVNLLGGLDAWEIRPIPLQ